MRWNGSITQADQIARLSEGCIARFEAKAPFAHESSGAMRSWRPWRCPLLEVMGLSALGGDGADGSGRPPCFLTASIALQATKPALANMPAPRRA